MSKENNKLQTNQDYIAKPYQEGGGEGEENKERERERKGKIKGKRKR